jgi:hypothetical protein
MSSKRVRCLTAFRWRSARRDEADANPYVRASKREKTRMLDELCELTGWTSRDAGRALQKVVHGSAERPRRTKDRVHGKDVQSLRLVCAALDGPPGRRLARSCPRRWRS